MLPPSQSQVIECFYLLFKLASKNVATIKCSVQTVQNQRTRKISDTFQLIGTRGNRILKF
jgi:hypothetical protein